MNNNHYETIVLAGGCFWCTEAIFKRLKGVIKVTPGYSGGRTDNPTYEQVCMGNTGHAEAVQVEFDPGIITLEKILDVFWAAHDPTSLNKQGADMGTQYRSAIFYTDERQKEIAESSKHALEENRKYSGPVVTEVVACKNFFPAEPEHLDFYNRNPSYEYCRMVIDPKIQKLYKDFKGEAV